MVHLVHVRTDAARNRARILDATRELVAARGADVSMDDIAAAAGLAVGTLYRHFPDKAALVAAVVADSTEAFAAATEHALAAIDAGGRPGDALAQLFRAVAERHATDRATKAAFAALGGAAAVLPDAEDEHGGYPPGSAGSRAVAGTRRLLERARAAGAVRPDVTIEDLALLLERVPGAEASEGARRRYVEIVLRGLTPG